MQYNNYMYMYTIGPVGVAIRQWIMDTLQEIRQQSIRGTCFFTVIDILTCTVHVVY